MIESRGASPSTEITLVDGSRHRVTGDVRTVEQIILAASRGSLMELAWLTEIDSGEELGINPECVMTLRAISS